MKIALIVAMGQNREIGKDNDLIWHLPKDMQFFKDSTKGEVVLMGRKNWDSIPVKYRPLPGRENAVLTRTEGLELDGATVFNTLEEAVAHYEALNDERTFFVIGGAEIYKLALDKGVIKEMYITHIDESFDAHAFFPEVDFSQWKEELIMTHQKDEKDIYDFVVKKYTKA